jgi:hypothetical protein
MIEMAKGSGPLNPAAEYGPQVIRQVSDDSRLALWTETRQGLACEDQKCRAQDPTPGEQGRETPERARAHSGRQQRKTRARQYRESEKTHKSIDNDRSHGDAQGRAGSMQLPDADGVAAQAGGQTLIEEEPDEHRFDSGSVAQLAPDRVHDDAPTHRNQERPDEDGPEGDSQYADWNLGNRSVDFGNVEIARDKRNQAG